MHDEGESALVTAFTALLRDAPTERAEHALRVAIKALVDTPRGRLGNRSPMVSSQDQQRWAELKPKLRVHLTTSKIGMSAVAREANLPVSTVQRSLSPAGPTPGRAIIELLARWLDSREATSLPGKKVDPSAVNGATPPEPDLNRDSRGGSRPLQAHQYRPPSGNGHARAGPLPAYRLTTQQRERLAGYLALDRSDVLRGAGVSREAAEAAVADAADLDPKVVERLAHFLGAPG